MKRLVANSSHFLSDFLEGFYLAHQANLHLNHSPLFLARRELSSKVAIISGGGSGHEPLHVGFIGHGMLDAACPGQIFSASTPDQIMAAIDHCHRDQGVLLLVKNYSGDVMNFEIAAETAKVPIATIVVQDDISGNPTSMGHRGIAGTVIVEKIVGAASERGHDLDYLKVLGNRVAKATRTLGIALTGATSPETGHRSFELNEQEYEFGIGIHGERGWQTQTYKDPAELIYNVAHALLAHLDLQRNSSLLVLVNGLGSVPLNELYILLKQFKDIVVGKGFHISRALTGNFATSLDMLGFSISVTEMDAELLSFWDAPVQTPSLSW